MTDANPLIEAIRAMIAGAYMQMVFGVAVDAEPLRGSYVLIHFQNTEHSAFQKAQDTIALVLQTRANTNSTTSTTVITLSVFGEACVFNVSPGDYTVLPASDVPEVRKRRLAVLTEIVFNGVYKNTILCDSTFGICPVLGFACGALVERRVALPTPAGHQLHRRLGMVLSYKDDKVAVVWFDDVLWYQTIACADLRLYDTQSPPLSEQQRSTYARMYGYVTNKFISACFAKQVGAPIDQLVAPFPLLHGPTATSTAAAAEEQHVSDETIGTKRQRRAK